MASHEGLPDRVHLNDDVLRVGRCRGAGEDLDHLHEVERGVGARWKRDEAQKGQREGDALSHGYFWRPSMAMSRSPVASASRRSSVRCGSALRSMRALNTNGLKNCFTCPTRVAPSVIAKLCGMR